MRKRIWLIVAIMLCVLGLAVGTASAAGGTYDGMTWDLTDGTLTLGGTLTNTEVRSISSWPWNSSRSQIQKVQFSSGTTLQGSLAYMFQNCTNLTEIDFTNANTANVWTFREMFRGCSKLESIGHLEDLDASMLRQTAGMFRDCSVLQSVALFNWDTSFVSDSENIIDFPRMNALDGVTKEKQNHHLLYSKTEP